MKKIKTHLLALFLALSMLLSLAACGGGEKGAADAAESEPLGAQDDLSKPQKDPNSTDTDLEGKVPAKGPQILRHVEYYVGGGSDELLSYVEYTYDEQGNCTECEEYKRINGEWKHFRHTEFTYDSQGRVQEKRIHTYSDIEDIDDTLLRIESAPDHVALSFGTGGSQEVYYYNDLGQCIKEELNNGYGQIYWYKAYTYDDAGKITEANLYYPSSETEGEYTLYSSCVYEYEGDAVSLLDVIHPAEPQPAESQPAQGSGTAAMLADYAGDYIAYHIGGTFAPMSMDANGVFSGTDIRSAGVTPSSVSLDADGSILIQFGENERFSIYPAGVLPSGAPAGLDTSTVNIRYMLIGGGVFAVWYHK